jgi:hypothetical protein
MFFDDPAAAFGNLRKALRRGGRLAFLCWRTREENPVFKTSGRDLLTCSGPAQRRCRTVRMSP